MDRPDRFFSLQPLRRRFLLRVVMSLMLVELALRILPSSRIHPLLTRLKRSEKRTNLSVAEWIGHAAWSVDVAARHLGIGKNCLTRAVALCLLAGADGVSLELRIGVRKDDSGHLAAHAWVEDTAGLTVGRRGVFVPLTGLRTEIS